MSNKIIIVSESDKIICHKDRTKISQEDIYRVSALWITNSKGDILLAKRALTKKHDPGKWGPAVAGTVEECESYQDNIIKEVEEEIGLKNIHPLLGPKLRVSGQHNFFTQWYLLNVDREIDQFQIRTEEVAGLKWFSKKELLANLKSSPELFLKNLASHVEMFEKIKIEPVFFDFNGKKIGGFIYHPNLPGKFPAVIFVHGFGGGTHESKNQIMCWELAENNLIAFMFDFYDKPNRLSQIPIEEMAVSLQLEILKAAIDFISKQNYVDKNQLGLTGHSLGGMTVVLYTPKDQRIKTLVVQSALSQFGESKSTAFEYYPDWKKKGYQIFDKSWGNMKINYYFIEDGLRYDVYSEAEKIKCPVLVFHGNQDESVNVSQSQELIKHLKPLDKLVIIKGADHCYRTNDTLPEATALLVNFMKKQLK